MRLANRKENERLLEEGGQEQSEYVQVVTTEWLELANAPWRSRL